MTEIQNEKIKCPCGSLLDAKSITRHNKTKKHMYYVEKGMIKFTDINEYQRIRFSSKTELREKQRKICKDYYEKNKDKIHERHQKNRDDRKKMMKKDIAKKICKCCKTILQNEVILQ